VASPRKKQDGLLPPFAPSSSLHLRGNDKRPRSAIALPPSAVSHLSGFASLRLWP
jgi:hypothetical protein